MCRFRDQLPFPWIQNSLICLLTTGVGSLGLMSLLWPEQRFLQRPWMSPGAVSKMLHKSNNSFVSSPPINIISNIFTVGKTASFYLSASDNIAVYIFFLPLHLSQCVYSFYTFKIKPSGSKWNSCCNQFQVDKWAIMSAEVMETQETVSAGKTLNSRRGTGWIHIDGDVRLFACFVVST